MNVKGMSSGPLNMTRCLFVLVLLSLKTFAILRYLALISDRTGGPGLLYFQEYIHCSVSNPLVACYVKVGLFRARNHQVGNSVVPFRPLRHPPCP